MAIEGRSDAGKAGRIRLGVVGGGEDAFIGAVHRLAARMDDHYELVAGALSSTPEKARRSAWPPTEFTTITKAWPRRNPNAPTASRRSPSSPPITCTPAPPTLSSR